MVVDPGQFSETIWICGSEHESNRLLKFDTNVAVCILVGMFILVEVICANQSESEFLSKFLSNFALREINFNKGKMKTARVI